MRPRMSEARSGFRSKYSPRKGTMRTPGSAPARRATRSECRPAQFTSKAALVSPASVATCIHLPFDTTRFTAARKAASAAAPVGGVENDNGTAARRQCHRGGHTDDPAAHDGNVVPRFHAGPSDGRGRRLRKHLDARNRNDQPPAPVAHIRELLGDLVLEIPG